MVPCARYTEIEFNETFRELNGNFSILHINARSIVKNYDAICNILDSINYNFTSIAITEIWLTKLTSTDVYNIAGYTFIHNKRVDHGEEGLLFSLKRY